MSFRSIQRLKTHSRLNLLARFMSKLELQSSLLIWLLVSYSLAHQFSIYSDSVKLFGVIFQISDCPCLWCSVGFPGGSVVKICLPIKIQHHPLPMQEMQVQPLGREDPLEKDMTTHSSILPGKSHGQRSLLGQSPWGCKESDMTE